MTQETKPEDYVLVRSLKNDALYAITKDSWADYKWDMKGQPLKFEEIFSGERGYLTLLERLGNNPEDYVP